jgi:cytochrome c5
MNRKCALLGTVVLGLVGLPAWAASPPQNQKTQASHAGKQTASSPKNDVHLSNGQRVFEQNCSRCHSDPDGFSSHISGTIARHMRVRASLSKKDEQELLRFLNP